MEPELQKAVSYCVSTEPQASRVGGVHMGVKAGFHARSKNEQEIELLHVPSSFHPCLPTHVHSTHASPC